MEPSLGLQSFTQSEDLNTISELMNELAALLRQNRAQADRLYTLADELSLPLESSSSSEEEEDRGDDARASNQTLAEENVALEQRIGETKARNAALVKLLVQYVTSLEHCINLLRQHVYDKTVGTLELHREYIQRIESEQNEFMGLVDTRNSLESGIFVLSRRLSGVLRETSNYSTPSQSIDYQLALRQTLQQYL
ncbi:hypothetical protein TRVA0_055S00254 [Trichomonascus vanleenenianus]|uniref:uncharacterized protein n=1 Tax=Trichomonascus vanleenenianus TaxID=2268995 RepID=UPI003EC9A43C